MIEKNKIVFFTLLKSIDEKGTILQNELLHVKNIVSFFLGLSDKSFEKYSKEYSIFLNRLSKKKKATKQEYMTMYTELNKLIESIDRDKKQILDLKDKLNHSQLNSIEILAHVSRIRSNYNETLKSLNLFSKRLQHSQESSFQLYLPSPLLHRRFRNQNIIMEIYNKFINGDDSNSFILSWNYVIGDTFQPKSLKDKENSTLLINASFWSLEMPEFIPLIMHEIGHHRFEMFKNKYNEEFQEQIEKCANIIHFNLDGKNPIGLSNENLSNLFEDIYCDLIGVKVFGYSYLLAIFYEGAGLNFDTTFLNENNELNYGVHTVNWRRDNFIIRIKVLLQYLDQNNDNNLPLWVRNQIDAIESIINDIYGNNALLHNIYINYYTNRFFTYNLVSKFVNYLAEFSGNYVIKSLDKNIDNDFAKSIQKKFDIKIDKSFNSQLPTDDNQKINLIFDHDNTRMIIKPNIPNFLNNINSIIDLLWYYRYTKTNELILENSDIFSENIYAGRIFRTFLSLENKYIQNVSTSKLNSLDELEVEEIIFVKTRKEKEYRDNNFSEPKHNIKSSYNNFLAQLKEDHKELYYVFGPYDFVFLRNSLKKMPDSAKQSEETLYRNRNTAYFYDRHALILIKENNFTQSANAFIATIDISVSSKQSYLVDQLTAKLQEKRINYKIYSSLGWEDIVLVLYSNSIEDLFSIKKHINSELADDIERTETTIGVNLTLTKEVLDDQNVESESKYQLVIKIRATGQLDITNLPLSILPGSHDYFYTEDIQSGKIIERLHNLFDHYFNIEAIQDIQIDIVEKADIKKIFN